MPAISPTDSEAIVMDSEGRNDVVFQMTMAAARRMLEDGTIERSEYEAFDAQMRKKYSPEFGALFSNINLICSE